MPNEYRFTLPVGEDEVRKLGVGDIVYLSGLVYTMRDMGHRRAVEMLKKGEALPFDLAAGAIWHCGPIVRKVPEGKAERGWQVVSAGSTTSSRFTRLGAELIRRLKVRFTVGKGTMGDEAVAAMQDVGSVYLNTTGGCACLYAEQVRAVEAVHWTDLGLPEATWVMRVENLGPLVVGVDSYGRSLFQSMRTQMQTNLAEIYNKAGLQVGYSMSYLPKRVPGRV